MGLVPHVALLRAVNVGGRNRVPMETLREIALEMGLTTPRTLLQSGNLVFGAEGGEGAAVATTLGGLIAARLGVVTPVIIRTGQDLEAILAFAPFPEAVREHPAQVLVAFLDRPCEPAGVAAVRSLAQGGEEVEGRGRELFIHYDAGVAGSRLTQTIIDRRLGAVGTARNWNTVTALGALAREVAAQF